jgi:integrase
MPLSDTTARNAKAPTGSRLAKLHDRDGLFLHVTSAGTKSWVMRYRIHGRERSATLGRYPAVGLAEARSRLKDAHSLLAEGTDPVQAKRRAKIAAAAADEARFAMLAVDWMQAQAWTPAWRQQVERRMKRDVLPMLGRLPVDDIDTATVQAVVNRAAKRGNVAALHVLQAVRSVLALAVQRKLLPYNAAREAIPPKRPKGEKQSYRHLDGSTPVRKLLDALDTYGGQPETAIGLRLLLLTFVRPSELRMAAWREFDLDAIDAGGLPAPVWNIPAERMKRGRPHVVPLSRQAVDLLRRLHALTGHRDLLFPHRRDHSKPMSRSAFIRALRDYMKVPTTAHGFRHLASTTLNSQGINPDWIELQLAHWREDTRGAYNKAAWLPERRRMMQHWADWLERVRAPADNVVTLRARA